jgi:hypothetical protein
MILYQSPIITHLELLRIEKPEQKYSKKHIIKSLPAVLFAKTAIFDLNMQFPLLSLTRFLCCKSLVTMQEVKLNKFHTSIMFLANSPIITRPEY